MITLTDTLVIISNLLVAMVTALAIWATVHEEHRHVEEEQVIHEWVRERKHADGPEAHEAEAHPTE